MNVLVTGGAGYIGSVVAERLLASGHTPVVYDNLSEGHRGAVTPGVALVTADIADRGALGDALRQHRIEAVIHMAAHALVGESMTDPSKYYRNNVSAGIELLDEMHAAGVGRIVFSSSAAIFGQPDISPIPEDAPARPTNPYGETKLAFERILHWYDLAHGIRYAALRYFNAAGATAKLGEDRSHETHIIPLVLDCALGRRPEVEIYGDDYPTPDGTCVRDYIHVSDLADAHILALAALAEGSRAYNLGNGSGYSVAEVVETARRVTGRSIAARVAPRRPGDPAELVASSEKIKRELGWEPRYPKLDEIIESAWTWRREHPHGYGE